MSQWGPWEHRLSAERVHHPADNVCNGARSRLLRFDEHDAWQRCVNIERATGKREAGGRAHHRRLLHLAVSARYRNAAHYATSVSAIPSASGAAFFEFRIVRFEGDFTPLSPFLQSCIG